MTYTMVTKILGNRLYIGEYKFKETVSTEMVPSIVTNELFERVQERKNKNKQAPARSKAKTD